MAIRKSTLLKKIKMLGYENYVIENADTDSERQIRLSCERISDDVNDPGPPGDYYGEFRGGYPWIDPKVEEIAELAESHWEWENPAIISLWLD